MQGLPQPSSLPPTPALAFLGDSVHSLYIRRMLVLRGVPKAGDLNRLSLLYVTAEKQAEAFRRIEPLLSETERDLCRRAANSHHLSRPHHASIGDYRAATGLEALLGAYEYCGERTRIDELLTAAYADTVFPDEAGENTDNDD